MDNHSKIEQLRAQQASPEFADVHFTRRMRDVLVRRDLETTYLTCFVRDDGASPVYALTVDEMESLLELLKPMRDDVERYDKVAVDALERELERVLFAERTRGSAPAPKSNAELLDLLVQQISRVFSSPSLLQIGDQMLAPSGETVTVVEEFGIHQFRCKDGRFHNDRGERVDFLLGYSVRLPDGTTAVARPCNLTYLDGHQSHLQLVDGGDDE